MILFPGESSVHILGTCFQWMVASAKLHIVMILFMICFFADDVVLLVYWFIRL